jgi:hypothetical protein
MSGVRQRRDAMPKLASEEIATLVWLMPRMAEAVPYLGYLVVAASKPG